MSQQDESQIREEPVQPSETEQMMTEAREELEAAWRQDPNRWQKREEDPETSLEDQWDALQEGWEPVVDLARHPKGQALTEEFQVLSKRLWMQLLEDQDPAAPVTMRLEEHEMLPETTQEENLRRIAALMNSVAQLMTSTGRQIVLRPN